MATALELKATEESTYVLNIAFEDEDDVPIIPNSATWTLTDDLGNIVNSRDAEVIPSLAASKDVVLTALDLELATTLHGNHRVFLVEYIYDSTLQNDLAAKSEATFDIENLTKVT